MIYIHTHIYIYIFFMVFIYYTNLYVMKYTKRDKRDVFWHATHIKMTENNRKKCKMLIGIIKLSEFIS